MVPWDTWLPILTFSFEAGEAARGGLFRASMVGSSAAKDFFVNFQRDVEISDLTWRLKDGGGRWWSIESLNLQTLE